MSGGPAPFPGPLAMAGAVAAHMEGEERYREVLRVPAMSVGLYKLPRDGRDEQRPHAEDELYYTLRGRARLLVGGSEQPVEPGSLHFVARGVEHRFHSIVEDLLLLVVFAPAEGSTDEGDA